MRMFYVLRRCCALELRAAARISRGKKKNRDGSDVQYVVKFQNGSFVSGFEFPETDPDFLQTLLCVLLRSGSSHTPSGSRFRFFLFFFLLQTTLQTDEVKNVPCGTRSVGCLLKQYQMYIQD